MTTRALGLSALSALWAAGALASLGATCAVASNTPADATHSPGAAPNSPPLTGRARANDGVEHGATQGRDAGAAEGAGTAPQAQADPLVSNGLGSPTCNGALGGELSATSRRDCETSGFVAAAAPSGDYGIDVHIDTGVFGLGSGALLSLVQDLIVTPLWTGLVWAVHALVVMLEWCFAIDLLDGSSAVGLGSGLRQAQAAFTEPWLAIALAVASMLVLYQGLIRRRVAETLGETLLMGAMMLAGLWVIGDPTGTVGALGRWANQASLGTLAVAARGAPSSPGRALGTSLQTVFAAAIEAPWCYLEFGDVSWCRQPAQLDPRLRDAGLKIAAQELEQVDCNGLAQTLGQCSAVHGTQAAALEHSAQLLRDAHSNGAIFLALPANGPARNSINEEGSLLRALCQSSEATDCSGPTAAQAEFRTNSGTWPRLAGLLLIAGGLLGMLLLLGYMALKLLAAAIFSLVLLLLAPAMVLAPAFGESGRALFRRWATRLLGAVASKLVFSFVLGALLAVLTILFELSALGWWTQWLLMSAFWWGAYTHRHQALVLPTTGNRYAATGAPARRSLARKAGGALETPRMGIAAARWAKDKLRREAPRTPPRVLAQAGREARVGADEQVTRALGAEHRHARQMAGDAPHTQRRLAVGRARLERLERERARALAVGARRRALRLGARENRVRGELERERQALEGAQRLVRDGERAQRRTGTPHARERREAWERFLDAQAMLPDAARMRGASARRDYAALAGLVGYGREEYERLGPRRQRAARLEIDRELALRRELGETAKALGTASSGDATALGRRERRKVDAGRTQETGRAEGVPSAECSSVMRDAFEVAAGRKRQLGRDRP